MARIDIGGGRHVGVAEQGGGERMPVIFLHGVGSDKSVWARQLDHFAAERRAIAFDYPGYGDSDSAPEGTTRDDYARAILAAMCSLDVARAHICGLSLGGVVASTARDSTPRVSKSFSRALSTLAEITGIARRSSEKRRCPSLRFQMISGVHTPPSRLMQADIGQPGGATFFLSFKAVTLTSARGGNLVSPVIPESTGHRKLSGLHG